MPGYEDRPYVVSGIGFRPLKIRGLENKKALIEKLRKDGFHPRAWRLNPESQSGKAATIRPTLYHDN